MTLRTPQFKRLTSAGAVRLSRELSIAAKERVQIFIIVVGQKDLHINGTAPFAQLDALIPDIAASCAEVA